MNLGIDFGSTYTTVSRYRTDHQVLEAYDSGEGVAIPSVVSMNKKNKVTTGFAAKDRTGKKGFRTFKAFKMLMMEKDQALVEYRQYDKTYTPKWAAETFMNAIVSEARRTFGEEEVAELVVGAPDVWFHNFETLSGRAILRDICNSIECVHNVRIVSEPVLASAYFAYNFQRETNKPFDGSILIIDYGGGTLDLSLTEIKKGKNSAYEIKMLESNGAGENTENCVGNAGIVYMETLMADVIRKHESPEEAEEIIGTDDFYAAVNDLEKQLKQEHKTGEIEQNFEEAGVDDLDFLEEVSLEDVIVCGDEEYEITYADLVRTYNRVIRPIFNEKMDEMIQWAERDHNIDVFKIKESNLKIALVGGFGNFYLVKNQMYEKFHFSQDDDKAKGIIHNEQDRERAISYGAALIASGIFETCKTAPYSIGIRSEINGRLETEYMIHYLNEIETDQPYYIMDDDGNKKILCLASNWAEEFVIDYGRGNKGAIRFSAKKEFKDKLANLVRNDFKTCCFGVSFGESDILRIHIREYDYETGMFDQEETIEEIGKFEETFEEIG